VTGRLEGTSGGLPTEPADLAATWRSRLVLALRGQGILSVATYLGVAYPVTAPFAAAALSAAAVVLGAFGWLRWQALPGRERAYARRLPRTDGRVPAVLLSGAAGFLALLAVLPAAMLGALGAARAATVLAVAATAAAVLLLAGRTAAPAAPSAPTPPSAGGVDRPRPTPERRGGAGAPGAG